jgi:hypothetical protein
VFLGVELAGPDAELAGEPGVALVVAFEAERRRDPPSVVARAVALRVPRPTTVTSAPSLVAISRMGFIWQTSSPGCSNSVQRKLPASFSP